jgi:hypothetical protein
LFFATNRARMRSDIPRADAFAVERLPGSLRARAEALLLRLLDSEALYTLVGGLKPLSAGLETIRVEKRETEAERTAMLRLVLPALSCGDVQIGLWPLSRRWGQTRYVDIAAWSTPAVARIIGRHKAVFTPLGITPATPPLSVAMLLERADPDAANRGLGHLYGYPPYAVAFFCDKKRGKYCDYFEVPTFTGKFVYAVPRGAKPRLEDIAFKESARLILAEYKRRRATYIGEGRPGPAKLLRDWFDDGSGRCSPDNARYQ